eukprot:scaffold2224_cov261-Pinguiococcus_pyrenoidosus.AAC.33
METICCLLQPCKCFKTSQSIRRGRPMMWPLPSQVESSRPVCHAGGHATPLRNISDSPPRARHSRTPRPLQSRHFCVLWHCVVCLGSETQETPADECLRGVFWAASLGFPRAAR